MPVLSAENLGVAFGAFDLFKGITVTVANDAKIGLIGPNGVGKTTLLLILAGINAPTTGQVHLARGRKIGYLRQEAVEAFADRDNTVYGEMLTVFSALQDQQAQLNQLESRMSAPGLPDDQVDALLAAYGAQQAAFEAAGGYDYDLRIQQTLIGLGLGKNAWEMPLRNLSGGQKTRALLARLLLEKPDLLMLDEPTNHLDIDAVEWLEHVLERWDGAVLIVSHDRYFLDHAVNTIWEMDRGSVETYSGNYSSYLMQRQDRWEYTERVYKEEKERLLKEVDYIQRNWVRESTHAQAMGRLRRLTRDLAIVDTYGVMALRSGKQWIDMGLRVERVLDVIDAIRQVNAIRVPDQRPPVIRPRFAAAPLSGNIVLRAREAAIGYPGNLLFHTGTLELRRGECAALIGPNGSGKTTFLKVLLGGLEPLAGRVDLGASLQVGYFAQAHDGLDPARTVLEELLSRKEIEEEQARRHLAHYLFRGEDVFKRVGLLSGGERARLALAALALAGANVLLLDEPTNHLDIPAREALQAVLEEFDGTILLVSHDRYLIDRLATQIWDIRGQRLVAFKGPYREFLLRAAAAGLESRSVAKAGRPVSLPGRPMIKGDGRATRKQLENLAQLEGRIHAHEIELQRLSKELQRASQANAAGEKRAFERVRDLGWQVAHAQAELERLMTEWEQEAAKTV
jgi:ATP-binding cassette subfamily F protein 3